MIREEREKNVENWTESRRLWDISKQNEGHILTVSENEEKDKVTERIFKEIKNENLQNLIKDMNQSSTNSKKDKPQKDPYQDTL